MFCNSRRRWAAKLESSFAWFPIQWCESTHIITRFFSCWFWWDTSALLCIINTENHIASHIRHKESKNREDLMSIEWKTYGYEKTLDSEKVPMQIDTWSLQGLFLPFNYSTWRHDGYFRLFKESSWNASDNLMACIHPRGN